MNKIQGKEILHYEKVRKVFILEADQRQTQKIKFFGKRAFDITFSLLVIIFLLSWLLPILAFFIKITSRGPVFFVQKRIGALGKSFSCIKLRTMVVNEQANTLQAQTDDPRITPFGKFLRVSCLDELPQFFNVLLGDMSVVGPRPHMIKDCKEFSKIVHNDNSRNLVKPGITGMAQVKGYRGQTKDFYDVVHRYKWDMFYVKNASFSLDIQIIKLTIISTLSTAFSKVYANKETDQIPTYQFKASEYLN